MLLLENQSTSTSASTQTTHTLNPINGYETRLIWAEGSFNSATATVKVKPTGCSTFIDPVLNQNGNNAMTVASAIPLKVPGTMEVRIDVTSAGSSTSITAGVCGP